MKLAFAYVSVIVIWASTPLAITISNRGFSFWAAGALRMAIAVCVLLPIVWLRAAPFWGNGKTLQSYLLGALGVLPNTLLVYWSAQYVPSGLISVAYSLSPFVVGVFSYVLLRDGEFTARRALALLVAAVGMAIIYVDQLHIDRESAYGVIALVGAVLAWGASAVGLKHLNVNVDPMCQTAGALLFSLPGLITCWWLFDGTVPVDPALDSLVAIVGLAIIGSIVGFSLYYYVLNRMSAVNTSFITLIVPIIALTLGVVTAGETLSLRLIVGVAIVLSSLFVYLNIGYRLLLRRVSGRFAKAEIS